MLEIRKCAKKIWCSDDVYINTWRFCCCLAMLKLCEMPLFQVLTKMFQRTSRMVFDMLFLEGEHDMVKTFEHFIRMSDLLNMYTL